MRPGLAAGWALVFVVIVGDLTASAILSGPQNIVVGSIFLQIWEAGRFAHLATLGMVICLTTASVVGIVLAFSGRKGKRSSKQDAETVASAVT
jgi:iron(III) transport system permease protein